MLPLLLVATLLAAEPRDVLVLGTLHQRHRDHPTYGYDTVARMIEAFDPGVLCVEIRPEDFRRDPYLQEMVLATIWGLAEGRTVVPMDWWQAEPNAREERAAFEQTKDYARLHRKEEVLYGKSGIVRDFIATYGTDFHARAAEYGPDFWNGPAFNDYHREVYRISVEIYGDSAENLYWLTRNQRMLAHITAALDAHPDARVLVLTGAEHKHAFDEALGGRADVRLAALPVPAAATALPEPVARFLETGDDEPYYDLSDPSVAFERDLARLVSLVHGPDMDMDPNLVPRENVPLARAVVDRLAAAHPEDFRVMFEQGWLAFLEDRQQEALTWFTTLEAATANYRGERLWFLDTLPRDRGLCLDLLGRREEALTAYQQGLAILGAEHPFAAYLYNPLLAQPFQWREP